MHKKSRKRIHQMTVRQFEALFPSDDACKAYLLNHRWPYGVRCPRCGHEKVYELPARPWHWQCHKCAPRGYRFSIVVGTVFENTNYPLLDWFRVIHTMLTSKKGVSALQIYRTMGMGSYRTAWYMCHRIRAGLQNEHFRKLMGIVEVDETYVGGKVKNNHWSDRDPDGGTGGIGSGKTPIAGAVSRKGNVVARVIEAADGPTLTRFVLETVSHKVSLLATDDNHAYRRLDRRYPPWHREAHARRVRSRRSPYPNHR